MRAISAVAALLVGVLHGEWLTGPIFDKELRVSSRRKRNYVLRFVYLGVLAVFVVLTWMSSVRGTSYNMGAYQLSRMSEAGKAIIATIIWFQFYSLQLVAVIMMSNAISDEVYHKTLGTLMTTPINSPQIVMGKLASKLWQLCILLAISLPLLAIVRVFGGVPWDYIVSSTCITLTAIIFAGVVSMYLSIHSRHAYAVILKTLFVGGLLYAFLPGLAGWTSSQIFNIRVENIMQVLVYINPFLALGMGTMEMSNPGFIPIDWNTTWPIHCLVMLAASGLVLLRCTAVVRKVALRQAVGQLDAFSSWRQRRRARRLAAEAAKGVGVAPPARLATDDDDGKIRPVKGSPIVWKELRSPLLRGGKVTAYLGVLAVAAGLAVTYTICAKEDCLATGTTHGVYALIFVILGVLVTSVLSSTAITSEKESRSWPILLMTPLTGWQIIFGKAVGIFRKCLPIWLLLAAHVAIFVGVGILSPVVILHLGLLVAWLVVFLTGTGLYFSSRFRRTTTAVVMNMTLALTLWLIAPMMFASTGQIGRDITNIRLDMNPVVQAYVVTEGANVVGRYRYRIFSSNGSGSGTKPLRYHWPAGESVDFEGTTGFMLLCALVYGTVGLLFALLAAGRVRKAIF